MIGTPVDVSTEKARIKAAYALLELCSVNKVDLIEMWLGSMIANFMIGMEPLQDIKENNEFAKRFADVIGVNLRVGGAILRHAAIIEHRIESKRGAANE